MFLNNLFQIAFFYSVVSAASVASQVDSNDNVQNTLTLKRDVPGYRNIAYFVNWAIYGRSFHPQNLTASTLTHVLYAFANIRPDTGEVYLSDTYADLEKHYPSDSWSETGTNLYGTLKQLYLLKNSHRNLKVLLSIGGWTYSPNFAPVASKPETRARFAASAIQLVRDLGFDGLDVDWEYPTDMKQAKDYVELLRVVREGLDALAVEMGIATGGGKFLLSVACPAGSRNYGMLDMKGMDRYLDFWNLMAYDFTGSFAPLTGHQANLHPSPYIPLATPFSASAAIKDYLTLIPASKLNLGMPLYGRAFASTTGLGRPFSPSGEGSWEAGIWDFKALPLKDHIEEYDPIVGAVYCIDPQKGVLVSYDGAPSVERKVRWAMEKGLGGVMWWEASGDRAGEGSLVGSAWRQMGGNGGVGIERRENVLGYKGSKYANLRAGMPGE